MLGTDFKASSYSGGNGQCIEAALPQSGTVAVRDSKDTAIPGITVSQH